MRTTGWAYAGTAKTVTTVGTANSAILTVTERNKFFILSSPAYQVNCPIHYATKPWFKDNRYWPSAAAAGAPPDSLAPHRGPHAGKNLPQFLDDARFHFILRDQFSHREIAKSRPQERLGKAAAA